MENATLLIKNAKVYNTYLKRFLPADVSVLDDRFFYIDRERSGEVAASHVLDAQGMYMLPGLIDIHMHIESSMVTPGPFGHFLASCGVTTIVAEPHEIANVEGLDGILEMIRAGEGAPVDIFYGIPSSVPSTRPELETSGGEIRFQEMKQLLKEKDVACVGEIMNYRQVIQENDLEITKFLDYLRRERPGWVIEGHCPSLTGLDLARFLYLGIDGDHTEHSLEEVKQRMENGMFLELQDKMLREDVLDYIAENNLYEYCCFVTDDTMADVLAGEGQLNRVVEKAIERGFPVEMALYCATYTPGRRMHLYDRGVIAPGRLADFMLVSDPVHLRPEHVFKNGVEIFDRKKPLSQPAADAFPEKFYRSVRIPRLSKEDFSMPLSRFCKNAEAGMDEVTVRVIEVQPHCTQTREKLVKMPVRNGRICWEQSGCMLAMVIERHGKNGAVGYGFITGSCHTQGTVATTYFHDHHNLFVAGDCVEDMELAVQRIVMLQGGVLTVRKRRILAELPLPICGILSPEPVDVVGSRLSSVRKSLLELGYRHMNPVMSVATLGLPVSPALKLTDQGLVDVGQSRIVNLVLTDS